MRIGDVKNHVLETLGARRVSLNSWKQNAEFQIRDATARLRAIEEELEGIRQTERLINTASNRGE